MYLCAEFSCVSMEKRSIDNNLVCGTSLFIILENALGLAYHMSKTYCYAICTCMK